MNDDELVARLRRTLHEQAEALHPTPGQVPAAGGTLRPETGEAGLYTSETEVSERGDRETAGAVPGAPGAEPRTAEYNLAPPTGPVPIFGRGRRRWPPVVGGVAVLAAAAAVALVVALSGHSRPVTVRPSNTGTSPARSVPTQVPTPVTTVVPPPTGNQHPSNGPGGAPADFMASSVTFVSADDGWVLGAIPCGNATCAELAQTRDGGQTWTLADVPAAMEAPGGSSGFQVRFANPEDGWIWSATSTAGGSGLWSTANGGLAWAAEPNPVPGSTIYDVEISGGQVQMVAVGAGGEKILTRPVAGGTWQVAPISPAIGAGPVLSPALTLSGPGGWLVNVNRTTVSGARNLGGAGWTSWTPPCATANGPAALGAASKADLEAVCREGEWGTPDPGTTAGSGWLYSSTDGGTTFRPVGPVPGKPTMISTPFGEPATIVAAGSQGLEATFDGGRTWNQVGGVGAGAVFRYVGFTTPTQGVAIATGPYPTLYMTRDGGHTWAPVTF